MLIPIPYRTGANEPSIVLFDIVGLWISSFHGYVYTCDSCEPHHGLITNKADQSEEGCEMRTRLFDAATSLSAAGKKKTNMQSE